MSRPLPPPRRPSPGLRQRIGLWAAPLAWLTASLLPLPLEPRAQRLLPVVAAVLIAWVTEALPIAVTAVLIAPAMVISGVTDAKTAFSPYASPILFVFVGGFFIARAMQRHGLDRRIARAVLSLRFVGHSGTRSRAALMLTAVMLSMWVSNTATTAILMPIVLGTLRDPDAYGTHSEGALLAVAYAASVGGPGTPVGSPPNLITLKLLEEAGVRWSFLDWVCVGTPAALGLSLLVFGYMQWKLPAQDDAVAIVEPITTPLSRGERVTALSFGLAVLGWLLPGVAEALRWPSASWLESHLPAGAVALSAASVLFLARDEQGELVLPWHDAERIDWGLVLLFGGGVSLGNQMFDTGLARALGHAFIEGTGVENIWMLTALASLLTLFMTEACSNMATANMLVPLVIGVALELGVSATAPALAVGLAASCAFMLPIATGPNAIVYGTGRVPLTAMLRHGFVLNLLCWAAIVAYVRVMAAWLNF